MIRDPGPPESELRRGRQLAPVVFPGGRRQESLQEPPVSRALRVPRGSPAACGDVQDRQCVLRADNQEDVLGRQSPAELVRPALSARRQVAEPRTAGPWGLRGQRCHSDPPGDRGLGRARAGGRLGTVRRGASSGLCCRHRPLLPSFGTRFTGTLFLAHVRCVPNSAPLQVELGGEDSALDPANSEQNVPRRLPKPSAPGKGREETPQRQPEPNPVTICTPTLTNADLTTSWLPRRDPQASPLRAVDSQGAAPPTAQGHPAGSRARGVLGEPPGAALWRENPALPS